MYYNVNEFQKKNIAIDDAVSFIKSDTDIIVAQCASEPQGCMERFHIIADKVNNVNVFSVLTLKPYDFFTSSKMKGHFKLCSWFHGGGARQALTENIGTVTFVPNMLHRSATDRLHVRKPHLFFGTCTPPDKHGFVSLSLGITYEKDIIENAEIIILEINENLPRTFGDTQVHISQVNYFVKNTKQVPTLPNQEPNEIDKKIGEYIASLVDDGATIQLGIGGIPNAAALSLKNKKNLGVHTEMLVDSMMELYMSGAINNSKKALKKDKMICTFAMGSEKLYDWLDNNPIVEFERGRWVNNPAIIRENSRMTSINTCLTVDFSGQISSESIGTKQYSGTGGQTDTAVGAVEGLDYLGKSIIACSSTKKNGTISSIVPTLLQGTAVTLHRSHTDYVVTEFGIASLRGRTLEERCKALISIAHPKFRDELSENATKSGILN